MVNDMKNDVEKKEYIERSEVENAIRALYPSMSTPDGSGENDDLILAAQEMCADAIKAVRDVPTADVVLVVRCRDCDFLCSYAPDEYRCYHSRAFVELNDFCNYGKKRKSKTKKTKVGRRSLL